VKLGEKLENRRSDLASKRSSRRGEQPTAGGPGRL